ncbi:hypothetical protein CARUB_v10028086mg, partial [Capsella rubella]
MVTSSNNTTYDDSNQDVMVTSSNNTADDDSNQDVTVTSANNTADAGSNEDVTVTSSNNTADDGSNQDETVTSTNNAAGGSPAGPRRPVMLKWKDGLHSKFLEAVEFLGERKALPKAIQRFMRVDGLSRKQISSHLQKYRRQMRKLKKKAAKAELAKENRNDISASSTSCDPLDSYKTKQLNMENLFKSQVGYDQSSILLYKNTSNSYMLHGRPVYDLSLTRSNLLPMGGSCGFSTGLLPLNQEGRSVLATPQDLARVVKLGKYGTPNGSLGMYSNQGTGHMQSNYSGIFVDAHGNLFGHGGAGRVGGNNAYGSLGESFSAMNLNFNNNNISNHGASPSINPSTFASSLANDGQTESYLLAQMYGRVPRSSNFGTSQASQVPLFGQYGTTNDVYDVARINANGYGDLTGLGGGRFYGGNVNDFLGENVGTMNMNFSNTNMTSHGSSSSSLSSPFSPLSFNMGPVQRNYNAQPDGLIPTLESLSVCNDHHDNGNQVYSQFDQNMGEGQARAGNVELSNYVLESWKFDNHQGQVGAENTELSNENFLNEHNNWIFNNQHQGQVSNAELFNNVLLEGNGINNWSFNNHQSQVNVGLANDVLSQRNAISSNWNFGYEQAMNEQALNSLAANSEMYMNSLAANSEMYTPSLERMSAINQVTTKNTFIK